MFIVKIQLVTIKKLKNNKRKTNCISNYEKNMHIFFCNTTIHVCSNSALSWMLLSDALPEHVQFDFILRFRKKLL